MGFSEAEALEFHRQGWWQEKTIGLVIRENSLNRPEGVAFIEDSTATTWAQYDERA
jgi:hypothetical protein